MSASSPSSALVAHSSLTHRARRALGLRFVARALRQVAWEIWVWLLHLRGTLCARRYRSGSELKLHLGCGPKRKPGWINIDLVAGADLTLDLRRALPFRAGSCATIYAEHFLEHLDYPDDVHAFLAECHRVVRRGGL